MYSVWGLSLSIIITMALTSRIYRPMRVYSTCYKRGRPMEHGSNDHCIIVVVSYGGLAKMFPISALSTGEIRISSGVTCKTFSARF